MRRTHPDRDKKEATSSKREFSVGSQVEFCFPEAFVCFDLMKRGDKRLK